MSEPDEDQGAHRPTLLYNNAENTMKIMLATDNHIGYLERDPVRGQDAINTFEEILQLAVKHDVDFILLAGDLFHENKPSRECIYRTSALLRKYTMGDKDIEIELLSDPMDGKSPGFDFPAINYEDPNFNVGIPVFSIHGNHDDPQGAGSEGALCALDLLSVTGLLNYFGRIELPTEAVAKEPGGVEGITIKPVLLRKGTTHLGMYGIGNVRDKRLHAELNEQRVKMLRPVNVNPEDWFNIFLIHQNRAKHGPTDYVPENLFDDSMNLVIWGHEHDCRIIPEVVQDKAYRISQPGSSVATSLAKGEEIQKHVALLTIEGNRYQLDPIPLRTVRPFIMDEILLLDAADDDGVDLGQPIEITKFLRTKIEELITRAKERRKEETEAYKAEVLEAGGEWEDRPDLENMLPLVRLRVDTTDVPNVGNPNRLGQEFQGRIANKDAVVYVQMKKRAAGRKVQVDQPDLSVDDADDSLSLSEKIAKVRVATLVQEYLAAQELQLLGEDGMSDAIQAFVDKDDSHSIESYIANHVKGILKDMSAKGDMQEGDMVDALADMKEKQAEVYNAEKEAARNRRAKDKGKGKAAAEDDQDDAGSVNSMELDDDYGGGGGDAMSLDEDEPVVPAKKKAAARKPAATTKAKAKPAPKAKAPARGRAKKPLFQDSDDDEEEDLQEEIEEDEEEEEPAPKPKKKSRADVLATTTKKAPVKKKAPAASSGSGRASTRTAASRAKSKMQESIEISD